VADGYVHGYATAEQERLVRQAEHWRDELILDGTSLAPGTRLLEVGCGVGAVLAVLGDAFPGVELAGVDIEERQIETARLHLSALGLDADLRVADAAHVPFPDETFDHVWMMWFLEHVPDPAAVLREARRVLVPGGELTAIEVDYTSVWAQPTTEGIEALFGAVARAMDASGGRSDTASRLPGWLEHAGFSSVDPGARPLRYEGEPLARQVPYVADVVEATLPDLVQMPGTSAGLLNAGLSDLRGLPQQPGGTMGWLVHKARAVR
jgi:ubiquinone/menaquinone biosynthesis C-methylase UbiE